MNGDHQPAQKQGQAVARQLTVVAIHGVAVLIDGASGLGKSSLALMLMDRGARLIGDDSVLLDASGEHLVAQPHPRTIGLLEVRNLGLLPVTAMNSARVALLIVLNPEAPRFIEAANRQDILGHLIPQVDLWPTEAALMAIKVELALKTYGLFQGE